MTAAPRQSRAATLNEREIVGRESFKTSLKDIAVSQNRSPAEVEKYARHCLREIAVRPRQGYLDWVARLARFMYTRSYAAALDTNTAQLQELKALAASRPLVFLWSHKSHLDSFVFMRAMYDHDFRPQPLSFAGVNMNFAGLGALAKRSGAIFLRRSFADDEVYKLVFKHYIDYLVEKRLPLSWSIEGTRSRTGKLMPPRLGLIYWVLDSYRRAACDDVLLVPVSISFDQIAEIDDYVAMQRGHAKRKESLGWFLGYISGMQKPFGKIYLRFARPLALSETVQVPDSLFDDSLAPAKKQVNKLALEVCSRIEHVTPIKATDLVTLVLLAANGRALTGDEIRAQINLVMALIAQRKLPTTNGLSLDGIQLQATLDALAGSGLLQCFSASAKAVYTIAADKQLAAAYYRNTIIHYFLDAALAELALATATEAPAQDGEELFWNNIKTLRDLFKFEFFFKSRGDFNKDIAGFLRFRYPHWRSALREHGLPAVALLQQVMPLFGHSILRSFTEAYQVVAAALLAAAGNAVSDHDALLSSCPALGEEMLLRRKIGSEASLSLPLFASGVRLAEHRGLLTGDAGALAENRQHFHEQLARTAAAVNLLQSCYDRRIDI